jgi:tripeptide aminopeptidase
MTAAAYLVAHPEIAHGTIRLGFTPDEEVGRGTQHFDVARFGAQFAYTLDGGRRGEIEMESFSADAHDGHLSRLQHPSGLCERPHGERHQRRPRASSIGCPTTRCRRERPTATRGSFTLRHDRGRATPPSVRLLIRDFVTAGAREKEAALEALAQRSRRRLSGIRVEVAVEESYRNMKEVLDRFPASRSITRARPSGVQASSRSPHPIRGGTDGSRLSFMGLPTPNLFAGEHNFHSRLEWVSVQDMEKGRRGYRPLVSGLGGKNLELPSAMSPFKEPS